MKTVFWHEMFLAGRTLQQGQVAQGEYIQLILPEEGQRMWLQHLIPGRAPVMNDKAWQVWLQTDSASIQAGTPVFLNEVGIMLHQRGAMSNLSLRENLLLPFLYDTDSKMLLQAEEELPGVAEFLDISELLEQQAGECPAYMHRLISLGRCLLQKPAIIIAQEVHAGISHDCMSRFGILFAEALRRLQSGLLYLSSSEQDVGGITFDRSLVGIP